MRQPRVPATGALLTLAALAPALSCTVPTEPMAIEFSVERQGTFAQVAPTVSAEAPGRIEAAGSLRTPCLPYDATGSLGQESRALTLTVTAHALGPCPQDSAGTLVYRAAIKHLPRGHYTVRVIHAYRDASWPDEVVFRQRVRVE